MQGVMLLGVSILVVLAQVLVGCVCTMSEPERVAVAFTRAFFNGNLEVAEKLLNRSREKLLELRADGLIDGKIPQSRVTEVYVDEFTPVLELVTGPLPPEGTILTEHDIAELINNHKAIETADVRLKVTFADGRMIPALLYMRKDSDEWKEGVCED